MQDEHKFVLLLARSVEMIRTGAVKRDEALNAVQGLVDYANRRSSTLRLVDGVLSIEGYTAPQDVPFVKTFIQQLNVHHVGEMRVGQGAPALDLLHFMRELSKETDEPSLAERLLAKGVLSINVVPASAMHDMNERRHVQVAMAFEEVIGAQGRLSGAESAAPSLEFVPAQEGAAYGQMVELTQASQTNLAAAVRRLKGHPDGAELSKGLNAVAAGVVAAVRDDRVPEAIDAVIAVIGQEEEEHREDVRLRYGVALRRILQKEVLNPLMEYLLDALYAKDVATIMRRAGTKGTELLLDLLVQAPTFAERRAFMDALCQIDQGTDMVVGMLRHHEWFVVRNVADLVGEMRIEEGVPGLGEACRHPDARVRQSAGLALAKIGSPAGVKHIGILLHDDDRNVRLNVAKQVGGKGLSALAMPMVNAVGKEEDDEVRQEYYRALGRVGSNDAVTALVKASKPGGLVIGRRNAADRLAAAEGLVAAGGARAKQALIELSNDRDKNVREVARAGLVNIDARGPSRPTRA